MPWDCYRLRAAIVDFADGALEEPARASVERHLADCSACSLAVLELREVPAELRRRLATEPSEAFFAAQRDAILRAVERSAPLPVPAAGERDSRLALAVRFGSLAAAAAAAFVFVSTWSTPPAEVTQVAKRQPTLAVEQAPVHDSATTSIDEVATTDPWSTDEGSLLGLADELLDQNSEDSAEGLI